MTGYQPLPPSPSPRRVTSPLRLAWLGVVTWAVPFAISALLFRPGEGPATPGPALKSLLLVVGSMVGAVLLVRVLGSSGGNPRAGLLAGWLWMAINVALDLLILLPLSGMSMGAYTGEIGARYLLMPIMGAAMDAARRGGSTGGNPPVDRYQDADRHDDPQHGHEQR